MRLTPLDRMAMTMPLLSSSTPRHPSFLIHKLTLRNMRLVSEDDGSLQHRRAVDQSAWQQSRLMLLYMSTSFY